MWRKTIIYSELSVCDPHKNSPEMLEDPTVREWMGSSRPYGVDTSSSTPVSLLLSWVFTALKVGVTPETVRAALIEIMVVRKLR